jgi:C4-type Zn-finger protein
MPGKDCPMCGDPMVLREREVTNRLPGTQQATTTKIREWVCRECDYFEDVDEGES